MLFNLVNDHEQVAQCVWRDMALRSMVSALGFISILRGVPALFLSVCVYYFHVALFPGHLQAALAVSGSLAY